MNEAHLLDVLMWMECYFGHIRNGMIPIQAVANADMQHPMGKMGDLGPFYTQYIERYLSS